MVMPARAGPQIEASWKPPGHGARQQRQRHHLRQQRVTRRPVDHHRRSACRESEVHPVDARAIPRGQRKLDRAGAPEQLRQHHDPAPVKTIGHLPGRQKQQDHRHELHQPHEGEGHGRTGALINIPAKRHGLRLLQDGGEKRAGDEQAIVADVKDGKGAVGAGRGPAHA